MASEGMLSLKWNNHKTTFFHVLSTIRSKEAYCDATIACDGRFYPVHKLVMSTCSDYFMEMFERTNCKHPVIVLKDIRHEDLEALLNYMYLGEVNVVKDDLDGLVKAAECLMIKGLAVPDEAPAEYPMESKRGATKENSPQAKRRRREVKDSGSNNNCKSSLKNQRHRESTSNSYQQHQSVLHSSIAPGQLFLLRPDSSSRLTTDRIPNHSGPSKSRSQDNNFQSNPEQSSSQDMQYIPSEMSEPEVVLDEVLEVKVEPEDIQDIEEALHEDTKNTMESLFYDEQGVQCYDAQIMTDATKSMCDNSATMDNTPADETSPSTKEPMTRKNRLQAYKVKCDRLIEFIQNGKSKLPGLNKYENRSLLRSTSTHIWDDTKQAIAEYNLENSIAPLKCEEQAITENNPEHCTSPLNRKEQAIMKNNPGNFISPSKCEEQPVIENNPVNCISPSKCELNTREERFKEYKINCNNLIKFLKSGDLNGLSASQIRKVRYQAKTHSFDLNKQELYYVGPKQEIKKRVITSEDDVLRIMKHCHSSSTGGHSGINGTLKSVSKFYIWNGIKEDITEYIRSCEECQRSEYIKTCAPRLIHTKVIEPLDLVDMDLLGMDVQEESHPE